MSYFTRDDWITQLTWEWYSRDSQIYPGGMDQDSLRVHRIRRSPQRVATKSTHYRSIVRGSTCRGHHQKLHSRSAKRDRAISDISSFERLYIPYQDIQKDDTSSNLPWRWHRELPVGDNCCQRRTSDSQDIEKSDPGNWMTNRYFIGNRRINKHTVRPSPIPNTFKLIGTPLSVPLAMAVFCCKKYLSIW